MNVDLRVMPWGTPTHHPLSSVPASSTHVVRKVWGVFAVIVSFLPAQTRTTPR